MGLRRCEPSRRDLWRRRIAASKLRGGVTRHTAALLLVAGLAACTTDAPAPAVSGAGDAGAPLAGLPPCEPATAAAEESAPADFPGLALLPEARITEVTRTGQITQILGQVPLTPLEVRARYQTGSGLTILLIEDEVFEAEVLATDGTHRLFVKAQAACATGSRFVAVVAPEAQAGSVPRPAGGG